ncbi:MAG: methyltransferase domain-containing protein [Bacteroidetes bacterium]|nr:methyltransferase domain-containing protein [Bacteroidota bacterium]
MLDAKEYDLFRDKSGIEVGGASYFFNGGSSNIYEIVKALDCVNFATNTIWEGQLIEGDTFVVCGKRGHQYINDATDLNKIESGKYEFVICCNMLEHVANPMKAIKEFLRIMKPDGLLLLVLPNKDTNFDHLRKVTKFKHLLDDLENDTREDDLSHLGEELLLHDLPMTPECGDRNFFMERSLKNFENRCLHQHVFDIDLLVQIYDYFNLEIISTDRTERDFVIMGRRVK